MAKKTKSLYVNKIKYIKRIVKHAKTGLPITQCVKLAGISYDTYLLWVKEDPKILETIETARTSTEQLLVKTAVTSALEKKNLPMIISLLEHLFPDRYSPRTVQQLQGANGDSVVFKIDASSGYIPPENVMGITPTLIHAKPKPS